MQTVILPSLLAADMGRLADEARRAEAAGADMLHLDIMDGHFVPNISMGPAVVAMARRVVKLPLSVHLMLTRPDQYLNDFIDAGADTVSIHIEADCDVPAALQRIRELGCRPGITLNPKTPAAMIFPVLPFVAEVLCMTVHPGYGGQAFMPEVLPKLADVRREADEQRLSELDIMVDGGITTDTAVACARHGANAFVAGTFLYGADAMAETITAMRRAIDAARAAAD